MNINQAIFIGTKLIGQKNSGLAAELLLAHQLKKERVYLFAHPEQTLSPSEMRRFFLLINKHKNGWPISYLTGEKEFFGIKFFVNRNVLIPRPETEIMVEEALTITQQTNQSVTIIDVGTGSGCIIIALAKTIISNDKSSCRSQTMAKRRKNSNYKFFGLDISKKSLAIAKKNAKLHGVEKNIKFINGDLLEPLIPTLKNKNLKFKIILANLPYLTPAQIKKSPTLKCDPKLALSAGPDGLKYYKKLFLQINKLARHSGTPQKPAANYCILCEIDPSQKASIERLAKRLLPPHEFRLKKDLRGHNRLAIIKKSDVR